MLVVTGDHSQQRGRVLDRAGDDAGHVLSRADRDDAPAACRAERRLDADNTTVMRRPDHRAVRLRAESPHAQIGRDGDGRAGARPPCVAFRVVRADHLAAA